MATFQHCDMEMNKSGTVSFWHFNRGLARQQTSTYVHSNTMAETPPLAILKAALKTIREQADYALKQLEDPQETRSMRWVCKDCRYVKHFTRPVTLEGAGRCPRCKCTEFKPIHEASLSSSGSADTASS